MCGDKFYNKQGLTTYSFVCGYVQDIRVADIHVELYLDGGVFATRVFRSSERLLWICEESLSDARYHFNTAIRNYLPELKSHNKDLMRDGNHAVLLNKPERNGMWVCNGYYAPSKWEAVAKSYNARLL